MVWVECEWSVGDLGGLYAYGVGGVWVECR